jgi:hypothetical protein
MRNLLSLLGLGLVGALTACAAPATATAPPAQAVVAVTQQSCGTHVVAGDADNGSTVCVVAGSDVSILLSATGASSWSTPAVTGHVLGPAMPLPTPYGRVGWQFRTIAAGRAEISTTRPGCPSAADCPAVAYHLYVTVR